MKNKKIFNVAKILLFSGAVLAMVSCGGKGEDSSSEHKHTFEEAWSTNANEHWHKATCEHEEEKGALGTHTYDGDKDANCNVCNYTRELPSHEHNFNGDYEKDETGHWKKCSDKTCNELSTKEEHDYEWTTVTPAGVDTNEVKDGVCKVCSFKIRTFGESGTHEWVWKTDDNKHWEESTCNNGHDVLKRNEENHTFVYESLSATQHQKVTNCGDKHEKMVFAAENHIFDNDDDLDCNLCGYERVPAPISSLGSFKTIKERTYNCSAQPLLETEYTIDASVKKYVQIQYKKDSETEFSITPPTDAGTYEVRLYCRGNALYEEGVLASSTLVIKQFEVSIRQTNFETPFDEAAYNDESIGFVEIATIPVNDASFGGEMEVTLRGYKAEYKALGAHSINVIDLGLDNPNFSLKMPSSVEAITCFIYDNNPLSLKTSATAYSRIETDYVYMQNVSVESGVISVGDYINSEAGLDMPLKVLGISVNNGDIATKATKGQTIALKLTRECLTKDNYKTKLLGTTLVKEDVEELTLRDNQTGNYLYTKNSTVNSRSMKKGDVRYLIFKHTFEGVGSLYMCNLRETNGGYYEGISLYYCESSNNKLYSPTNGFYLSNGSLSKLTFTVLVKITHTGDYSKMNTAYYLELAKKANV